MPQYNPVKTFKLQQPLYYDKQKIIAKLQKLRLTFAPRQNIILGYNFIIKTLKEPVT